MKYFAALLMISTSHQNVAKKFDTEIIAVIAQFFYLICENQITFVLFCRLLGYERLSVIRLPNDLFGCHLSFPLGKPRQKAIFQLAGFAVNVATNSSDIMAEIPQISFQQIVKPKRATVGDACRKIHDGIEARLLYFRRAVQFCIGTFSDLDDQFAVFFCYVKVAVHFTPLLSVV
jgi:hypothetical protein